MRRTVILVAMPFLLAASCEDVGAPNISGLPGYLISTVRISPEIDTIFVRLDSIATAAPVTFTATAIGKNGSPLSNMQFVWSVSNSAIANVNEDGVVTPLGTGTVFVTASADKTARATLVILPLASAY